MFRLIKQTSIISAIVVSTLVGISCGEKAPTSAPPASNCGTLDGNQLYKDVEGCYYLNNSGAKEYVSSSNCRC